jgi:hypothetical protein
LAQVVVVPQEAAVPQEVEALLAVVLELVRVGALG